MNRQCPDVVPRQLSTSTQDAHYSNANEDCEYATEIRLERLWTSSNQSCSSLNNKSSNKPAHLTVCIQVIVGIVVLCDYLIV